MLEDENAPTLDQRIQMAVGDRLAMSDALHALIATHPNPKAFEALLDFYASETAKILLLIPALQLDNGMRQAYGEMLRSMRGAIPQG